MLELLSDIEGVACESAPGVAEAWRCIQAHPPDVVVLDIQLPDGSGLDLLHTIKAAGLPTIVIMLTSFLSPQWREKCLDAGADFFFDKYDEFQRVAEVVERLTHRDLERP